MKLLLPVAISPGDGRGRPVRAAASLKVLESISEPLDKALELIELDYTALIAALHVLIEKRRKGEKVDPRRYWIGGDLIFQFRARLKAMGFYLVGEAETLGRDLDRSKTFMQRLTTFRRRYPQISDVDPRVSWTAVRGGGEGPTEKIMRSKESHLH